MNAPETELVNELQNASSDGGFANGGDVGKGALRHLVFEDDAVEFRDVQLVSGGARRDVK